MTNRTARFVVCFALALATLASRGRALAQDAPAEGAPPAEGTAPPAAPAARASSSGGGYLSPTDVTLRQGAISIDGDVVVNLSSGAVGKPVQIVPNLYYGVNDALTVGFAQNPLAEIFQTTGSGICFGGSANGCPSFYNNFSLDGLYSFMRSSTMDFAGHGGVDFGSLDPFQLSLRAGVKGKMMAGPLIFVFDPFISFGLNDRSGANGNKEVVALPLRAGFMATPQLNVGASIGLIGPLDGFGDNVAVPLGVGATFAVSNMVDVRAQFTLTDLAGNSGGLTGTAAGAADLRAISVGAAYRM
jgi:hypothetical protein